LFLQNSNRPKISHKQTDFKDELRTLYYFILPTLKTPESLKEKTIILNEPKTNTDHHNGDFNLFLVSFTHFKWLTFKELV